MSEVTKSQPRTKLESVLAAFADGARITRFDAERQLHDHVLPSTVAEIQRLGIRADRQPVTVPGHRGKPTRCALYWMTSAERAKARRFLKASR